jgi:hypothetical protein
VWSPLRVVAAETTIDTLCAPNGVIVNPVLLCAVVLSETASSIEIKIVSFAVIQLKAYEI